MENLTITEKNSSIMKTHVETFIIEETQELIYDNEQLSKWNEQVESLGLEGQKKIVLKEKSPIPFLWLNSTMLNVFKTLCPRQVDIKKYDKTPIPVEILSLVALSQREQYFDFIEIWYNDEDKDPVCIGYRVQEEYKNRESYYQTTYSEKYILGRWADVKQSFTELAARAKAIFIQKKTAELKKRIRDAERELEDLQFNCDQRLGVDEQDLLPF